MEQVLVRENMTDRTEQLSDPKWHCFSCTWEGESSCFDLSGAVT